MRNQKQEEINFKCFGCKNIYDKKEHIVKHKYSEHEYYFCLNCDYWVKDKSKVMDENWSLYDRYGNLRTDV